MKKENPVQIQSYQFALKVIRLGTALSQEKKEYVLSKQILRSGTSIGANVEEALQAISKKDFIFKMSIALKEAPETRYWLRLLHDSHFIEAKTASPLIEDIASIINLLTSIIKTSRSRMDTV